MKYSPIKRDVSKYRFALPNNIWTRNLKAPAFAVLAYLQYRHCRRFSSVITLEELAERIRMSIETAKACVETLINHKLLTVDLVPILPNIKGGKFFTVPDEVFYLGLGHGAITVYAYLLCCEDRRTHQCHPSYNTISSAVDLAVNTVMKHISTLADKQLITVERTSYIDNKGMKWNGNNLYTILPIQQVLDTFYQQQLDRLESTAKRQRAAKLLREQENPA